MTSSGSVSVTARDGRPNLRGRPRREPLPLAVREPRNRAIEDCRMGVNASLSNGAMARLATTTATRTTGYKAIGNPYSNGCLGLGDLGFLGDPGFLGCQVSWVPGATSTMGC